MAVDRKADYVGNHGGAYSDIDGMSRQFTYVDHDKKLKITFNSTSSFNNEYDAMKEYIKDHPLCHKYMKKNKLDWDSYMPLSTLIEIKKLIDGQLQKPINKKNN